MAEEYKYEDVFTSDVERITRRIQSSSYRGKLPVDVIADVNSHVFDTGFLDYLLSLPNETMKIILKYQNIFYNEEEIREKIRKKKWDDMDILFLLNLETIIYDGYIDVHNKTEKPDYVFNEEDFL